LLKLIFHLVNDSYQFHASAESENASHLKIVLEKI